MLYWSAVPLLIYYTAAAMKQGWSLESVEKTYEIVAIYFIVQGALSVILDVYIFFLPMPIILGLHLSLKRRLSILGIFGTAIL